MTKYTPKSDDVWDIVDGIANERGRLGRKIERAFQSAATTLEKELIANSVAPKAAIRKVNQALLDFDCDGLNVDAEVYEAMMVVFQRGILAHLKFTMENTENS